MNITSFINQTLKANSELLKLTNNQIYPICADEDSKGSYIVFQQDGQNPVYYQESTKRINNTPVTARIYVVSQDYDEAVSILSKVTDILETNGCEFTSLYNEDYDQVYEYFVIETQIEKRM